MQGASNASNADALREHFVALPMLAPNNPAMTHARAGALYACCRWRGITPRSPHDCQNTQTAIEHGVSLLHDDRDFDLMAGVEHLLTLLRD